MTGVRSQKKTKKRTSNSERPASNKKADVNHRKEAENAKKTK